MSRIISSPALGNVLQVGKTTGLQFLGAAAQAWKERLVLMVGDNSSLGLTPDRTVIVAAGGGWWDGEFLTDDSEEIAQISSTSGTTGLPKGIAISRRAVSNTVDRLCQHMELDESVREYVGVPVTFSFGLGRARAVAAAGGKVYLPHNGFRPDEIAGMMRAGEINALSAVPTMLRTLLAHPQIMGDAGKKLRWLEIGSQPMSAEEKRAIGGLFPNAIILQHYGLTEASRSTFLRVDQATDEQLESVGRAVSGGSVRIGADGNIELAGAQLASGIIENGQIAPLTGPDGWLRTADLGHMRRNWLYFHGREDNVANIGGTKISAELFEQSIEAEGGERSEFAVCVISDELRGQKLAVASLPGQQHLMATAIASARSIHGLKSADVIQIEIAEFPKTETGKLQRSVLAKLLEGNIVAAASLSPQAAPRSEVTSPREKEIASIWAAALNLTHVAPGDSFYDLGGDSLSAVLVMIRAEQAGLSPDVIQRMIGGETVAQIAAALDSDIGTANSASAPADIRSIRADALNAMRGLFATFIILSHWGPFFIERMGVAGSVIWKFAGPFLRVGTPGFAMIYGMGLGLFFFGQLENGKDRLKQRIRTNTHLLIAGVLLVGAAQAWRLYATGEGFGPIWPEQLFYEVLLFYALMVPTSLFWLNQVNAAKDRVKASLLLAAAAYAVYVICAALTPVNMFTGWPSLAWHMAVAPYAYTRLLGATALGLAGALWLQKYDNREALAGQLGKGGLILGISGSLLVAILPGGWSANAGTLSAIPCFAGVVMLLYAAAVQIVRRPATPSAVMIVIRLAIVAGMLAFPIFIGHGMVMPLRSVLEAYGVAPQMALALPLLAFLIIVGWLSWRIYRMMFSRKEAVKG